MFKKRSKKGLSHVDWAMSLGIFLLYLAWFFIFVKPLLAPEGSMDALLDILEDGVTDHISQEVSRVQVFVPGGFSSHYAPMIIPFDELWSSSDMSHTADHFVVDDAKMFFMANLSNTTTFHFYHPHEALTSAAPAAIIADEDIARSGDFSAYFDDHILDRVLFLGDERLRDFTVEVDDTIIGDVGSFQNWTFLAKYQSAGDYINISSYVFAENTGIYSYIAPSDYRNHSVVIGFTAYNYTDFYFDPISNGELEYSAREDCRYYTSGFLDLYDSTAGLLVMFSRNISIRLCTNETNPAVQLEFDSYSGSEDRLIIMFHEGGVDDVIDYPIEPVVGVTETLDTFSADRLSLLKNRDYGYLKQLFGYPDRRDFNIAFTSDVVSVSAGAAPPDLEDVYARDVEGYVLDKDYQMKRVSLTLNVW
jgi:hypothetical protein